MATFTAAPPKATSTTAPIDLASPPMTVGSSYLYFDGSLLVAVPGGPFIMGGGGSDNRKHTITLSDFWIYSTKVTNRQFAQCVAVGKCTSPDLQDDQTYSDPNHQNDPVVGVIWAQAAAYCDYAHGQLPTEAQWEKTARGPNGNIYPWGNSAPSTNLLNFDGFIGHTTNVINYPQGKSYYRALDIEGNVYEWVNDWYNAFYYQTGPAQDPLGPDAGNWRSVRSGGYKSTVDQVVASTRFFKLPTDHARDLGFRCVVTDPTYFAPSCQLTPLGGTSGPASGKPICPNLSVSVGYTGCWTKAYAVVKFDDSFNADANASLTGVGGCAANAPGSHYAQYTCTNIPSGGLEVGISSLCNIPILINPTCPAHYNLVNAMCQWDGSGTAGKNCPTGAQYDPAQLCCTTAPDTVANFPACPAGTVFQPLPKGVFECLPVQDGIVPPANAHVDPPLNHCGPEQNGVCTLTVSSCRSINEDLDPARCTCYYH
ncbi:MAG: SUMF1/EgtB/PvdO family nonheme iron enzyme [Anaerolineales bacterium]